MEDIDFDNLYNTVLNMNKSTKDKCYICHFPIENKENENETILECKHGYHTDCIKNNNIKNNCPYCGKVNKKTTDNKKPKNNIICTNILKSGKNKGMVCGRNNCYYHNIIL